MPFSHLADVTTAGAPDEVVNWFGTFQAWMTALGWTVENVITAVNIVFRSTSELGGLTMLWMRVWQDLGNPTRIRFEVRDDLAGTHETNEGGYIDTAGAQFAFWMSGDKDAIIVCARGGAVYRSVYAGMVLPFAATVPDETYRMIATSLHNTGSILRDAGGVWDVDHPIYWSAVMDDALIDRYDGSLPLGGTYFDRRANIAGQLLHVSCPIHDPGPVVMDVLETGRPGATTDWIVMSYGGAFLYAMRTGGVLPTGVVDPGTFAAATGVVANYAALWAAIAAFAVAQGWTDLGDPGWLDSGRFFSSPGESGVDEIFAGFAMQIDVGVGLDRFYAYVTDDAVPTHRFPTATPLYLDAAEFPINYWICGDADCLVLVIQRPGGYGLFWSGLIPAFAPGLLAPWAGPVLSPYQLVSLKQGDGIGLNISGGLIRGHDGAWNQTVYFYDEGGNDLLSNPNNFDATTYLVWPLLVCEVIAAINCEVIGQMRYVGFSDGGGIANMDTITVGAEVYTVFHDSTGDNFCVRTV